MDAEKGGSGTNPQETDHSRRSFVKKVGGIVFSLVLVDWNPGTGPLALGATCGNGCVDSGCSTTNTDENCGQPVAGPNGDVDQGCSATDNDNNCSISQVPNPSHDSDGNCTATSADPDQSCGDCDDNHDSDEHCGVNNDPDDLCGHQHAIGLHEDQACSATVSDVGCGKHCTTYGGEDTDNDQHCVGTNTDMNCTGQQNDQNCNAQSNPSTTSPDESCAAGSTDEACGYYDKDEACNATNDTDQSCGDKFGVHNDQDQSCSATQVDENCGHSLGLFSTDTDEHCVGGNPDANA